VIAGLDSNFADEIKDYPDPARGRLRGARFFLAKNNYIYTKMGYAI
jgi:hypothetical protein